MMDIKEYIFLVAPAAAWLCAHAIKFALTYISSGGKERSLSIFLRAGGMPSSHSAVVTATMVVIGAREGLDSAVFGLGSAVSAIIIFDALNVRRSVGQQGEVLKKVISDLNAKHTFFIARGHTVTEVIGGVSVGAIVGYILLQIL